MQTENLLFSIVVPCYNRGSLISIAVNSVLSQTISNWELIVVDDGSTDNTEEVIKCFNDNRIHYLKTENRERGAARNSGIKLSKGNYIVLLDSDDYLLPNHLETVESIIVKNPSIDFLHLNYEFRSVSGDLVRKSSKLPKVLNSILVGTNVIGCAGVVMEKQLALSNPFSEIRGLSGTEDYELWLRIASKIELYHFPQVTTVMVEHDGRSMVETDISKIEQRILLFVHLTKNNKEIAKFLGWKWRYFFSNRFSYISLHASLDGKIQVSLKYWLKAFVKFPFFCFSTRSFSIIKNIIVKFF